MTEVEDENYRKLGFPYLKRAFTKPSDIFSTLLLLGPDIIKSAVAQQSGIKLGICALPISFSFGCVSYSLLLLTSVIGDQKLMPASPDFPCVVINSQSGHSRNNSSWILGRLMRDFPDWMDESMKLWANTPTLCVGIYEPKAEPNQGMPVPDWIAFSGLVAIVCQLLLTVGPILLYSDWTVLLITVMGNLLVWLTILLPAWSNEKWVCRKNTTQSFIITRGNGGQHAIVILGNGKGLNLEDLASAHKPVGSKTRWSVFLLALLQVVLLVMCASANEGNGSRFLLAIGAVGMGQNILVAAYPRDPSALGIHLEYKAHFVKENTFATILEVEKNYPGIGNTMVSTFFPSGLRDESEAQLREVQDSRNG
ncbi:hypothetical protein BDV95DRAFT_493492 [Massariosphaeria phaeospora]|uniref:Uncharacterized protein n=1 Tax=Massariosphaeria phaeospora TaxID=100035 RepID=A0A7C8M620_9PLEO|nr:hypothetical protein BDV95DRAFT_493492 [Massariosphaeria phaeospora]